MMKKIILVFLVVILILCLSPIMLRAFGINVPGNNWILGTNASGSAKINVKSPIIISKYITDLKAPRFMKVTNQGDLIIAQTGASNVLFIPYNQPSKKQVLVQDLNRPHSIDIFDKTLYIAERNAIGKISFNEQSGQVYGQYEHVIKPLPEDGMHWTRTLKFGPDGYGYLTIGSSCNVCIEKNRLFATMQRFKPGEYKLETFATGLRNTVGFDWSPQNKKLYGTDNGRDWLGDDFPPDELNSIQKDGFYGWPYFNGNNVRDPDFGDLKSPANPLPPVFSFKPHNAPLGITFIKRPSSPYYQKALVALHGSWNSSVKVGYKVVALAFENGQIESEDVINFLNNGQVTGRPVHVVEGLHNELYLSDDYNGVIYKIQFK